MVNVVERKVGVCGVIGVGKLVKVKRRVFVGLVIYILVTILVE